MADFEKEICIFESFRIYQGKIFRFAEHLKRLKASANSCGIQIPLLSEIEKKVLKEMISKKIADGFIRLNFRAGKMQIIANQRRHSPEIYKTGVDLRTSSFRAPSSKESTVQAKTGFYRMQLLAGRPEGAYDWLFLNGNHFLTESRVGNFFMVKKGQILTAPAVSVLNGITREVVIECARESGFSVHETPLTRHEAFNADEAFLTNTSWEILPVRSLDGRLMKLPIPGPVTQKLITCFHRKVERECHLQKKPSPILKSSARLSPSRTRKG